jgi:hypothetical protein
MELTLSLQVKERVWSEKDGDRDEWSNHSIGAEELADPIRHDQGDQRS